MDQELNDESEIICRDGVCHTGSCSISQLMIHVLTCTERLIAEWFIVDSFLNLFWKIERRRFFVEELTICRRFVVFVFRIAVFVFSTTACIALSCGVFLHFQFTAVSKGKPDKITDGMEGHLQKSLDVHLFIAKVNLNQSVQSFPIRSNIISMIGACSADEKRHFWRRQSTHEINASMSKRIFTSRVYSFLLISWQLSGCGVWYHCVDSSLTSAVCANLCGNDLILRLGCGAPAWTKKPQASV